MSESLYQINNLLHTIIGSLAMLGGLIALLAVKGSKRHKLAGKVFAFLLVLSALSSFYPTIIKFREIGPVAIITGVGAIYLVLTAMIAIRHQESGGLIREKFLAFIPLLLLFLPVMLILRAIKTGNFEIFIGPLALGSLFLYCFITDVALIRQRQRSRDFWVKRHLTRMIFAFGFGMMAVIRIGLDLGISFEMSLVLPLLGALFPIVYFRWQLKQKL